MSQPEASGSDAVKVEVLGDGEINQAMSVSDVVQCLGLTGNGEGGLVHVRNLKTLLGTGVAFTASEVRIVELNPPEATLRIKGISNRSSKRVIQTLVVNVDDLSIAEQDKVEVDEKDPLKKKPGWRCHVCPATTTTATYGSGCNMRSSHS